MAERPDPSCNTWLRPAAVLGSMLPIVIVGSSCQTGDGGGFGITKVEFDNDSTITLTFSEPVAPVDAIDPNDFRLSFAVTYSIRYEYDGVTYQYENVQYRDALYAIDGDYYYGPERLTFASAARGAAANQIVLSTSRPLGPDACDTIDQLLTFFEMYADYYGADARIDAALFLHYAGGDVPIESEAGGVLANIGADWVTSQSLVTERESYGFTMLFPQLRIPCPP